MKATKVAILVLGAVLVSPELMNSRLFAQHEQHTQPQAPPAAPTEVPVSAKQSAPTLSLEELEQMALGSNPTLAQAVAEVRAAEGRKRQAGLYPNPTAGYTGEEMRGGASRGGQQGFFVRQDIVLGGKLGLSRRVFEQERLQAGAEADEQKLRVLTNVRLLYFQALAAQQIVELRRHLHQLAKDAEQTSHQLANVGQADRPDVLQAEVETQQAELALLAAEKRQMRIWKSLAAVVGRPDLPMAQLEGNLEDIPDFNQDLWLETILRGSPAVKLAELGVRRAELALARARREPIPDLQIRGGLQQNRELQGASGRPIGLQGFAEVGIQIPLFNRNQGNIQATQAELERARQELLRVKLLLRERSASFLQNYLTAREAVDLYKNGMIPRAREAYELYLKKYQGMGAAYPQVLIAQRTLFQLQTDYIMTLENLWTNSVAARGFLLTDGLEAPSRPGELDRPVREVNMPSATAVSSQER